MMSIPVAAFDPIFWLHHCQVERLLTLWQTITTLSRYPIRNPNLIISTLNLNNSK